MIDEKYGSSRQHSYGGGARIIIAAAEAAVATTYPELMVVGRAGGQRGNCIGAPPGMMITGGQVAGRLGGKRP